MQRRFYFSLFLHPSVKIYYSDYSGDDDVCMRVQDSCDLELQDR
jgi:hypothetical protein